MTVGVGNRPDKLLPQYNTTVNQKVIHGGQVPSRENTSHDSSLSALVPREHSLDKMLAVPNPCCNVNAVVTVIVQTMTRGKQLGTGIES